MMIHWKTSKGGGNRTERRGLIGRIFEYSVHLQNLSTRYSLSKKSLKCGMHISFNQIISKVNKIPG